MLLQFFHQIGVRMTGAALIGQELRFGRVGFRCEMSELC